VVQEAVPIPRYPGRRVQILRRTTNASKEKCLAVQSCIGALKRPPRLPTCHRKDVCSSRDGCILWQLFRSGKARKRFMEAPPLILSEICLKSRICFNRCCGISRTSIFVLFPVLCVLSFLRSSQVLRSSICQLQAFHWHFAGPRDSLARLPQELG
jgi:hypothetical protein